MSTPDPGEARAYENERRRHRNRIDALLDSITERAGYLRAFMADGRTAFASDAKNLVADAVHLVERLAALEALNEVSCPPPRETPMADETDERPVLTVRKRPCPTCPYRRDVPSGIWAESEYEKLPRYDGDTMAQAVAQATGVFQCHQRTGELCAGWAGCHDMRHNFALRICPDRVDPAVYDYVSPVPLFASGAEAAAHGMRDIEQPGPEAQCKAAQVMKVERARRAVAAIVAPRQEG